MGYAIVFETADPVLRIAAYTAAIACVLVVMLLIGIVLLRAVRKLNERRTLRVTQDWRPLLAQCAVAAPVTFPHLRRRDRYAFLELWNHHYELMRGDALQHLRVFAIGVRVRPFLFKRLRSVSVRGRLIAATTLGHLRATPAVSELERMAHNRSAALSFTAARALLEIDPGAYLPQLLLMIAQRPEWPLSRIALALTDLGANTFSAPLARAALTAAQQPDTQAGLPRLLRLMEIAHNVDVMPAVDQLLRRADALGPEVIAPCLRLLDDPREAHWARRFATHDVWFVRVSAAQALQRIGVANDGDLLTGMLCDPHWWVRYRAAHALANLPDMTPDALMQLADAHQNPLATEIMRQVIAERALS